MKAAAKATSAAKIESAATGEATAAKRGATPSGSLTRAVARIPGYRAHRPARWVLTTRYGHWGVSDVAKNTIYLSPTVPMNRLDAVVRHEWSHILTVRAYGGDVSAAIAGTNHVFGSSGLTGLERSADCMARQLGATWTNYTSCTRSDWRADAARLLAGHRP